MFPSINYFEDLLFWNFILSSQPLLVVNYTPLRRQLKYVKLSETRRVLLCLKLKYHQSKKSKQ
ncbi:hypothetical protein, partial [Clostridioides difficile]|uniref:hypothetical protein n=1 Tax=Clostridioides difficile TaxID=1496 RepID=UPI001A9C035B